MVIFALEVKLGIGNALIGLVVGPEHNAKGNGRFIVEYVYWQASLPGFVTTTLEGQKRGCVRFVTYKEGSYASLCQCI